MKILLSSMELETLTGQPMYTYNLAKGLKELGHEVVCVGFRIGGKITYWLEQLGIKVYKFTDRNWLGKYDLAVISENFPQFLDHIDCDNVYNLCHSKGDLDKPIDDPRIEGYLFPRKEVMDYWGVKGDILPIPIDIKKWQVLREKQPNYTILAPCTIDSLRTKFLLKLMERANEDTRVWIVGKDHGGLKGEIPKYVSIFPETPNIIYHMRKADEVASIFMGTVVFEAWAMGLKTSVYDEKGNYNEVPKGKVYDYLEVANMLIKNRPKA